MEVQRVVARLVSQQVQRTRFARNTQWFDAEAEQPCRVAEVEVTEIAYAGTNDRSTLTVRPVWWRLRHRVAKRVSSRRTAGPRGFSGPSNYCSVALAAFAVFLAASSAASVTSDAAFADALMLFCTTSTACFVGFCAFS